jgi:hypothetical protein
MKKGIESLKADVMRDCSEGENCFSENGCTKERYKTLPQDNPALLEMGIKTKCVQNTKCFHDYCGKYKWILERATHYAETTGKTQEQVIEAWESDRTYWYMNFYQECNQPEIKSDNVIMYDDWIAELKNRFGTDAKKWAFKCPSCGNVQSGEDFINAEVENPQGKVYFNCIGRHVIRKGCDWTLGGLLKIHTQSVVKDGHITPVFEMADKPGTV